MVKECISSTGDMCRVSPYYECMPNCRYNGYENNKEVEIYKDIVSYINDIDRERNEEYTQKQIKSKRKKKTQMSFAGVGNFQGKMIGFADKRSSIIENGVYRKDERNQPVKKIWKRDNYLIAFTGINSFFSIKNSDAVNLSLVYIEDWIEAHYQNFCCPDDLCIELFKYLREVSAFDYGTACGISITKKDNTFIMQSVDITKQSINFERHFSDNGMFLLSGINIYQDMFRENLRKIVTINESQLRETLIQIEKNYDITQKGYNPVGDGWDIYIF